MPNVEAIVLNPISAHSLKQCPILPPHHSVLDVRPVFSHEIDTALITADVPPAPALGPRVRVRSK